MLSKFTIEVCNKARLQMAVQSSEDIAWQGKSLKNWQHLMPVGSWN